MKTIKELKDSEDYLDERSNGYYWALKDVIKLMNEIREKEAVVTTADWEELKQMIEGDSEK